MLPFAVRIGQRLRAIRGTLSREQFARELDIKPERLSAYERGEALPEGWVIVQLHEGLGINPLWLIAGLGPPRRGEEVSSVRPKTPGVLSSFRLFFSLVEATNKVIRRKRLLLSGEERAELAATAYSIANTARTLSEQEELEALTPKALESAVEFALSLKNIKGADAVKRMPKRPGRTPKG